MPPPKLKGNMEKNYLFIAKTHGDEKIGEEVLTQLSKLFSFDWIIGNKKASKINRRFYNIDLNRAAPGKQKTKIYEEKRAFEILNIAKKYKFIIDIHGTVSNSGIFIIITNPKPENLVLASKLPIKNVVVWVAKNKEIINPLSEFFPCGLEIECGPKDSVKIKKELMSILKDILRGSKKQVDQNYFQVYGFKRGKWNYSLRDFKKTKFENEEFYPILCNQYKGIVCYKMRKIDFIDFYSY